MNPDLVILGSILVVLIVLEIVRAVRTTNRAFDDSNDGFHPLYGRAPRPRGATRK